MVYNLFVYFKIDACLPACLLISSIHYFNNNHEILSFLRSKTTVEKTKYNNIFSLEKEKNILNKTNKK